MAKTAVADRKKEPNAVVRYFRETAAELRKVTWPTRQEARELTTVVIVVVVVTAIALGLLSGIGGQGGCVRLGFIYDFLGLHLHFT